MYPDGESVLEVVSLVAVAGQQQVGATVGPSLRAEEGGNKNRLCSKTSRRVAGRVAKVDFARQQTVYKFEGEYPNMMKPVSTRTTLVTFYYYFYMT